MKMTWNMALAAVAMLGCVVALSFAQQPELPRTPAPSSAGAGGAVNIPPAATAAPLGLAAQPPAAGSEDVQTVIEVTSDGRKLYRTIRSADAARGGGGWSVYGYGPAASDPDAAKLYAAEEEAAKEAQTIVTKLRSLTDEKGDVEDIKKLREALTKQFEAQQKRRAHEIGKIEERLGKLKDTMKKRDSAKDTIIGRRVDELTGVTDELGWEETGSGARVRSIESNYGPPGLSPVPVTPRGYPAAPGAGGGSPDARR